MITFCEKLIPTEGLVKITEFVLKSNYFEFNYTTICLYIWTTSRISFSKTNRFSLGFGSRTLMIFFIWKAIEKELDDFLERLNNFYPNLKSAHERSREEINSLDFTVRVNYGEFMTNLYYKPTDSQQYLRFESCRPSHTKS